MNQHQYPDGEAPTYMQAMSAALTYRGSRLGLAWRMAVASYHYTASFIGNTDPAHEPTFTRWDAISGAVECFWGQLWRKA